MCVRFTMVFPLPLNVIIINFDHAADDDVHVDCAITLLQASLLLSQYSKLGAHNRRKYATQLSSRFLCGYRKFYSLPKNAYLMWGPTSNG